MDAILMLAATQTMSTSSVQALGQLSSGRSSVQNPVSNLDNRLHTAIDS